MGDSHAAEVGIGHDKDARCILGESGDAIEGAVAGWLAPGDGGAEVDAHAEQAVAHDGRQGGPPARIRQDGEPETPNQAALRWRLGSRVLQHPGRVARSRLLGAALLVDRQLGA